MKISKSSCSAFNLPCRSGFSLIEVVLAIGIFLVTVLALVGLLGPTLQSVDEVEKTDEIASVVNTVNAFLQSSPDIAPNASKFDAVYSAVRDDNYATVFVFRQYFDEATGNTSATATDVRLNVGFSGTDTPVDAGARITDFSNTAGPIYRVVLTVSSVVPENGVDFDGNDVNYRSANRDRTTNVYDLNAILGNYSEGYFAMEVRIFAEDAPPPGQNFDDTKDLVELADAEPLFTYNTAIVR